MHKYSSLGEMVAKGKFTSSDLFIELDKRVNGLHKFLGYKFVDVSSLSGNFSCVRLVLNKGLAQYQINTVK